MRKYKKVLKDELDDVVCDICNKSCIVDGCVQDPLMAEFAVLEASWGYCSKKDETQKRLEICEICYDKVISFIESIK
jgi:hypothetical protein